MLHPTASSTPQKLDKAMTEDQFTQVVEAILAGKYSWACLLILKFAGYNPLHYIPCRTYYRLLKENFMAAHSSCCAQGKSRELQADSESSSDRSHLRALKDLAYLEVNNENVSQVRGGYSSYWLMGRHSIRH